MLKNNSLLKTIIQAAKTTLFIPDAIILNFDTDYIKALKHLLIYTKLMLKYEIVCLLIYL